MDFKAICTDLANQYSYSATPSGADAIQQFHGQAPQGLTQTPAIVVIPTDGTRTYGDAQWQDELHLDVLFYLSKAPGDIARVETQRQLWLPVLLAATHGPNAQGGAQSHMALGLDPTVLKAIPTGWEYRELQYDADSYDGIVIHVTVYTREYGTFTA